MEPYDERLPQVRTAPEHSSAARHPPCWHATPAPCSNTERCSAGRAPVYPLPSFVISNRTLAATNFRAVTLRLLKHTWHPSACPHPVPSHWPPGSRPRAAAVLPGRLPGHEARVQQVPVRGHHKRWGRGEGGWQYGGYAVGGLANGSGKYTTGAQLLWCWARVTATRTPTHHPACQHVGSCHDTQRYRAER